MVDGWAAAALLACLLLQGRASAGEKTQWGKEVNGLRCAIAMSPTALRVGDPFVIDVKVQNASDKPVRLYYPSVYLAQQLVIRNEKGDIVRCRQTAVYGPPDRRTFFRPIKPGETFRTQIKGRIRFKFIRAADLPAKGAKREILFDCRDTAHDIARPGKFTARLRLTADEKALALAKRLGIGPVWTGALDSDPLAFSVRRMTREELDKIMETLRTGVKEGGREAIQVLAANADRQAVPALMEILTKGPGPLAVPAADALGAIQDTSVVPDLLALYKLLSKHRRDDPERFQPILLRTISALTPDPRKRADLFVEILASDASVEARSYAASGLAFLKHPQRLTALVEAAKDGDPRMRRAVASVLGNLAEFAPAKAKSKYTGPLVQIMKSDADRTVRSRAAAALANSGDKSVVPALVEALKDPNRWVGSYAAHSLGRLAGPEVIPALEAYAKVAERKSQADAARRAIELIRQRARGAQ